MDCILVPEKSQIKTVVVRHGGKERCCCRIRSHLGQLCGVFVLLLLIFVPNLYLFLRTEQLQSELSVHKDIIDKLVQKLQQTEKSLEPSESVHNHKNHHKNLNSTSWRSKRSDRKFRWKTTRNDGTFSNPNPLGLEFIEERPQSILAIRVEEKGFYMVYSKIHSNGRKPPYDIENAHVGYFVKVDRQMPDRTNTTFKLSMSVVTQDERGHPYADLPTVSGNVTPVDEVTDMGVYYLEAEDEIYIQASKDSQNCAWQTSEHKANFVILRLC